MKKLLTLCLLLTTGLTGYGQSNDVFDKTIKPILEKNCYSCHSHEADRIKGDLTLDTQAGIESVLDNKTDLTKSTLAQQIISREMPPKKEMSSKDASLLLSWIRQGAKLPENMKKDKDSDAWGTKIQTHWAFQPQYKPEMPQFDMEGYQNPIDNFIAAKLENIGLGLSPRANKRDLIRRIYYDMLGIPPTYEDVQSFVNDNSPGAWETVVDKVLQSPHYGERWGRHWLDVARYSDYKGGSNNRRDDPRYVYAWSYRDYVIKSLNSDKPYDQFIKEQLAADLMVRGRKRTPQEMEALAGLGFLTVGRRDRNNDDVIDDRIDAVSKAFLGLTVSCARCHDHKFDPITQKDYYSFHGIFSSITEPDEFQLPVVRDTSSLKQFNEYAKLREEAIKNINKYKMDGYTKWHDHFRKTSGEYIVHTYMYYNEVPGPNRGQYSRTNEVDNVRGLVNRMMSNWNREMNSNNPFWTPYKELIKQDPKTWNVSLHKMSQDKKKYDFGVVRSLQVRKPQTKQQLANWYGNVFTVAYKDLVENKKKNPKYMPGNKLHKKAVEILLKDKGPCDLGNLDTFYRILNNRERTRYENGLRNVTAKFINLEWEHVAVPVRAMVVQERAPVTSRIYILGNARTKGDPAPRSFLEYFDKSGKVYPQNQSGRLQLAESIINNPLSSRVIVNRIWQHHFGKGIVDTPDDLGIQSPDPTHPELLDWLAVYLKENNWKLKSLHKLILTSKTYQQSSKPEAVAENLDSGNQLLHRQNIRRVEFESIRDTMFKLSNNLSNEMGGGPVNLFTKPYSKKRSIYGVIDRRNVPELLSNFDFADPNLPTGKRFNTTIPQQSLFMLNGQMAIDIIKLFCKNNVGETAAQTVTNFYKVAYQRMPTQIEVKLGVDFIQSAKPEKLTPEEQFAQVVLLSNEIIHIK